MQSCASKMVLTIQVKTMKRAKGSGSHRLRVEVWTHVCLLSKVSRYQINALRIIIASGLETSTVSSRTDIVSYPPKPRRCLMSLMISAEILDASRLETS